jgi:hypothetical protein
MSGGIFPDYPFKFNVKCIIFTAFIAGGYWFLPTKNIWILLFLLWLPYISLAWYDYAYKCSFQMEPTIIPFGRYFFLPFKPPDYQQRYRELPPEAIKAMDTLDHISSWTIFIIISFIIARYTLFRSKV